MKECTRAKLNSFSVNEYDRRKNWTRGGCYGKNEMLSVVESVKIIGLDCCRFFHRKISATRLELNPSNGLCAKTMHLQRRP